LPLPKVLFAVVVLLGAFCLHSPVSFGASATKDEVLAKYERAVSLTEESHLFQKDVQNITPKVQFAGQALLKNDFTTADRVLNEVMAQIEDLQKKRPQENRSEFRLAWLEIYVSVFQWFAVIAILAFFFVKWSFFRTMLEQNHLTFPGKGVLAVLTALFAIFLSIFDLSRYGESSWMFFDIQLVLVTVGGLLGGLGVGVFAGSCVTLFRYFLKSHSLVFQWLPLVAGVSGGLFSLRIRDQQNSAKTALLAGLMLGLVHSVAVYFPTGELGSRYYLFFAVALLTALEGMGVFLFFVIISGILREETRRKLQYDFIKTRLLLLQSQLRPHFLFNALNTIAAVCGGGDAAGGEKLILKLSNFLRHTFDRKEEMVTLRQEMSFVDAFLEIEAARFGTRLRVEKELLLSEEAWDRRIPMLVLQPLAENAIRHGASKRTEGGTVKIRIEESGEVLKFMISDNGPGRDAGFFKELLAGRAIADDIGIGVRNIHERLIKLFGEGHGLYYESVPGNGTSVTMEIPAPLGGTTP